MDVFPFGVIRPCCKWRPQVDDEEFKVTVFSPLREYQEAEHIKKAKEQMLSGARPAQCVRCWDEEDAGIPSKRLLDYERHGEELNKYDLDSGKLLTISLSLGNHCNLKCRICSPWSSTKWIKEWATHTGQELPQFKFFEDEGFINEVISEIDDVIHIDFPGGEPLLVVAMEAQLKILNHLIDSGQARKTSLHYTTNATVMPTYQLWDAWGHFKNVDLQMSLDGMGYQFEYNRYPAKWDKVYENIQTYKDVEKRRPNFQISIAHTVSVFTIYYLDEFYNWCLTENLPEPWLGSLHQPMHYRPGIFPPKGKEKVCEKLLSSSHPEVRDWVKFIQDDTSSLNHLPYFKKWVSQVDEYRGESFQDTFPEIYPLLYEE